VRHMVSLPKFSIHLYAIVITIMFLFVKLE